MQWQRHSNIVQKQWQRGMDDKGDRQIGNEGKENEKTNAV